MLATGTAELYPPSEATDDHGWRLPGAEPYWQGPANLQLQAGISRPQAGPGGGRGPFGPARDDTGVLYLPDDPGLAALRDGWVALVRGKRYVLSQARYVADPAGAGLACWAATATSVDSWPPPDEPAGPGPALGGP